MKVSVLLSDAEAERFDEYCKLNGFKKSTLIARLIREHLEREKFSLQPSILDKSRASNNQSELKKRARNTDDR